MEPTRGQKVLSFIFIFCLTADKRLDEWVDIDRIKPLKAQPVVDPKAEEPPKADATEATNEPDQDPDQPAARPKRKIVKDELALLTELMPSLARKVHDLSSVPRVCKILKTKFAWLKLIHGHTLNMKNVHREPLKLARRDQDLQHHTRAKRTMCPGFGT